MKDLNEKFFLIFRYKILLTRSIYCISHSYAFFLFFFSVIIIIIIITIVIIVFYICIPQHTAHVLLL